MSILSDKYGLPEETVKKMMRDGVISCSWDTYDQIAKLKREGKTWDEIAFETGMSIRNAQYIYSRVK